MQDPSGWNFSSNISWGANSEYIYFQYNPENNPSDSLYRVSVKNPQQLEKVSWQDENKLLPRYGDFNDARNRKVYTRDGELYLYDLRKQEERKLLELNGSISDPQFLANENQVSFILDNNAFLYNLDSGMVTRLTNIRTGSEKDDQEKELTAQDQWLQDENLQLCKK